MTMERDNHVYEFECRYCGHVWRWNYEVRQQRSSAGNSWDVYFRDGVPVASPWIGPTCPGCQHYRIRVELVRRPGEDPLTPLGSALAEVPPLT